MKKSVNKNFYFVFLGIFIIFLSMGFVSAGLLDNFWNKLTGKVVYSPNSMIAYYSFEGNANDGSGNGNNGVNRGATFTTGKIGQGASFNSGDMIKVTLTSPITSISTYTFSAWVKFDCNQNPGTHNILSLYSDAMSSDGGLHAMLVENNQLMYLRGWNYEPRANTEIDCSMVGDGNWHHIISGYDGSSSFIYVDGDSKSSVASDSYDFDGPYLGIGGGDWLSGGVDYGFNGMIDEVKVWNYVLSSSEITTEYNRGTSCIPSCSGKTCGDNGCEGSCGTCQSGQTCTNGNCVGNNTCTDSDGGLNYNVKGQTIKGSEFNEDWCGNSLLLREYYCSSNGNISAEFNHVCTNGTSCSYGSCGIYECTDTDGGKNYNLKGTLTQGEYTYTDFCGNSQILRENYCTNNGTIGQDYNHVCTNGTSCSYGSCGIYECTDTDGGKNYNLKGTLTQGEYSYTDYCGNSKLLTEYYCTNNGTIGQDYNHVCTNCTNGVCV